MKKTNIAAALSALLLSALLLLAGCGAASPAPAPTPAPEPTSAPTPEPTPTPFMEPVMEQGGSVYFDGRELPGGRRLCEGGEYVLLSEAAQALGSALEHGEGSGDFSFAWRKSAVELSAQSTQARYLDRERELDAPPLLCSGGDDLLVPLESFCAAAEIGYFYDEEPDAVYCSPAAGDWELPENYAVPVLMYHDIGHAHGDPTANLILLPETLEQQFAWLNENGFTTIWFEDLWHVEDFEKPVILVFDDGYMSMYSYLLPLAEKYQIKAVVAIVEDFVNKDTLWHMNSDEVQALYDSGLIALESHGVSHLDLSETWNVPDPEPEIRDSKLWLTRLFKKEPIVFVYPIGGSTPAAQECVRQYYRFGVKMFGPAYNTSDDPTMVYRYFIEKQTPMSWYDSWLNGAFDDPSLNNYRPRSRG